MVSCQFATAQSWSSFDYQTGDFLFQDLNCGALCDAIEKVTPALEGKHFSHIGLVYVVQDSAWVVEAIGEKVQVTPLRNFMLRQVDSLGNPEVAVGRLQKAYRHLNARAVGFALQQKDKPYDENFIYDNGKYYCSELLFDAYKEANQGRAFFHLQPMTYKDPATGKTLPAWKKYFKKRKMKIPEGRLGCNPGSIAISDQVEIIARFYK